MISKWFYIMIVFFVLQNNLILSQSTIIPNLRDIHQFEFNSVSPDQKETERNPFPVLPKTEDWTEEADAWLMFIFLYAINPILSAEINGKLKWGWTKEVSLGFGKLGQLRTSVEYSWVDFEKNQNIFRAALKYDILLKSKINYAKSPVESSVITIGGGYFTDFDRYGYFPELSYGYSFRDDKNLLYPSLKLRYAFMNEGPDIMDFSFGLVVGFANPFIHYDKPKKKKDK
ncbi:MAG: hypothetical protein IPL53_15995 [Ignavibacteria bacterium]|nr:hypothetical protein [Ignavibacteria bacterium]